MIPESDMPYLKPDEAQKKIITDFQKTKVGSPSSTTNTTENQSEDAKRAMKVRSKSKLSIQLSKFKKEKSFTYSNSQKKGQDPNSQKALGQPASQIPMISTSVPSTPIVEDSINGNQNHYLHHHKSFAQKIQQNPSNPNPNPSESSGTKEPAKRLSRIGSFFNAKEPEKTSAIVPPFNYSPPENQQKPQQRTIPSGTNPSSSTAVKRNDSYLGSMGRPRADKLRHDLTGKKSRENTGGQEKSTQQDGNEDQSAPTSSVMVTMV